MANGIYIDYLFPIVLDIMILNNCRTFPPLNIALYNVLNGSGDELYGIEPPMYYVKNLLLMVGLATFPLAIASPVLLLIRQFCITLKRNPNVDSNGGIAWVLYLTAFIWMSLLFSRPHKVARFSRTRQSNLKSSLFRKNASCIRYIHYCVSWVPMLLTPY